MLKTNQIFTMRKDIPDISMDAYMLFCFILFRHSGSELRHDQKKYVTLTGKNDPRKVFGWSDRKYWNVKKELVDKHLIKSVKIGQKKAAEIYPTFSEYKAHKEKCTARFNTVKSCTAQFGSSELHDSVVDTCQNVQVHLDIKRNEKEIERAEPQKASPASLTPVRFRDLENEVLTPDQKLALTALVRMEQRYNNLKKVDKWGAVNEWSAVLAGNGYKPEDMIKASELVFQHDDFQTFMPTSIRFRDFADEAKRQREEWEYNDKFFKGEL